MATQLSCQTRTTNTKGIKKLLRKEGQIPAIVYGRDFNNVLLAVNYKDVSQLLKKRNDLSVLDLVIDNQVHSAVIKEIQTCIVTGKIIHLDFQKVYADQPINKEVPIRLVGDQIAKKSGVIQFQKREIEVRGLPHEIPSQIDLDISPLTAGSVVSVGQIVVPMGLEVYTPKEEVVLSLVAGGYNDLDIEETTEGEIT